MPRTEWNHSAHKRKSEVPKKRCIQEGDVKVLVLETCEMLRNKPSTRKIQSFSFISSKRRNDPHDDSISTGWYTHWVPVHGNPTSTRLHKIPSVIGFCRQASEILISQINASPSMHLICLRKKQVTFSSFLPEATMTQSWCWSQSSQGPTRESGSFYMEWWWYTLTHLWTSRRASFL